MTRPAAYYNEIDPGAAAWLRELIARGLIAPGVVDERSIEDVAPEDLAGFTQCHFFAGIGVWSHALRRAGWPDDRPLWTASCPCQPFSAAGKGKGVADERHLWPALFHLVEIRRPSVLIGEQVASKDGLAWLDIVSADLEGSGYAIGAADLCAAGFGLDWEESQGSEWLRRAIRDCPDPVAIGLLRDFADWAGGNLVAGGWHIRQRLYWVAHAHDARLEGRREPGCERAAERLARPGVLAGGLADADSINGRRVLRGPGEVHCSGNGSACERSSGLCDAGGLAHAHGRNAGAERQQCGRKLGQLAQDGGAVLGLGHADSIATGRIGAAVRGAEGREGRGRYGHDADASGDIGGANPRNAGRGNPDWIFCRDAKWRPVEPGSFPLTDGAPARMGQLRGYGNALDAETATAFIRAVAGAIVGAATC